MNVIGLGKTKTILIIKEENGKHGNTQEKHNGKMTVDQFKELKPELAHLEGDELWDTMTEYILSIGGESPYLSDEEVFVYRLEPCGFIIFDATEQSNDVKFPNRVIWSNKKQENE